MTKKKETVAKETRKRQLIKNETVRALLYGLGLAVWVFVDEVFFRDDVLLDVGFLTTVSSSVLPVSTFESDFLGGDICGCSSDNYLCAVEID